MRAFFALFVCHSLGRKLIQWRRHNRGLRFRFRYDFFFRRTVHLHFSFVSRKLLATAALSDFLKFVPVPIKGARPHWQGEKSLAEAGQR
jgi:hypothetical protein